MSLWICTVYVQVVAVWWERVYNEGTLSDQNFWIDLSWLVDRGSGLLHTEIVFGDWVHMYKKGWID